MKNATRGILGGLKMNRTIKTFCFLFLATFVTSSFADDKKKLTPTANDRRVARAVAQHIPRAHYTRTPINDDFSKKLFDEYFDTLDPNKYFFYQSDLKKFDDLRTKLDDQVREGDVTFAFDVYTLFLERLNERVEWMKKRLEKPFDYTKDEYIILDREDEERADDEEEYNELWRKRIKNSLLLYQMINEATEEKKDDKDLTEDEKKELRDEELFPHKSPKERLLKSFDLMQKRYTEYDNSDVLEIYLSTLTHIYDPHSSYMAPKTMEDFEIQMKLSLQGIGATLQSDSGFTKITKLVPGGPAEKGGELKRGDRIIAVAQENGETVDIIDMPLDKVVKLIRGEKGSKVILTVLDGEKGLNSKPKMVEVIRDKIQLKESEAKGEIKEVRYSSLNQDLRKIFEKDAKVSPSLRTESVPTVREDGSKDAEADAKSPTPDAQLPTPKLDKKLKIGVITIPSFYADFEAVSSRNPNAKTLTTDVMNILADMKDDKVDGLVLDLRGNGGGSLSEAIRLTGLFIPEGPVVQIGYGPGIDPKVDRDEDGITFYRGPLVVMVNKMSASASEIFAGAIQDYNRGVIVGDKKTHGKGTVQTIFDMDRLFRLPSLFKLPSAGTLKFTVQKFYRITGASTQKKGVEADIVFPSFTDHMEMGEERLPHVLEWDEVSKAKFTPYDREALNIPALTQKSLARREKNEKFKVLNEEIAEYAEKLKDKKVSLNKEKRSEERKKDDEVFERRRALLMPETEFSGDEENTEDDLYLEETLMIISDMVLAKNDSGTMAKR